MKKTLAILLTLIILITSVSYDSYAADTYGMPSLPAETPFWIRFSNPDATSGIRCYVYTFSNIDFKLEKDQAFQISEGTNLSFGQFAWQGYWYALAPVYIENNIKSFTLPKDSTIDTVEITSNFNYQALMTPDYIPTPDEYLYITLPREGFKTIDKFMTYNVMYSIAAENINDVTLKIYDENNVPFTEAPLIESFDALNHTATLENGYLKGHVQIWADYLDTYTGPVGVNISVLNTASNRELKVARNVEIMPFTDADGDGIDDNTGEDQFYRPDIPGLDDLDLDLGTAVDTIRTVIPNINNGVANIVALLAVMFSWLPDQVSSLIILIMILIAITTIIKILRG